MLAFALSFYFSLSTAFYFHVGEREEKCIIEDIPSDTLVTGRRVCPRASGPGVVLCAVLISWCGYSPAGGSPDSPGESSGDANLP